MQVTVPEAWLHEPWPSVADTNPTPAGSLPDTTPAVSGSGPPFATANEYTSAPPTATGSGESVFATDKSAAAAACTVVCSASLSSAPFGSAGSPLTAAVLVTVPAWPGAVTAIVTVAIPPFPSPPSLPRPFPEACLHEPWLAVSDITPSPAGSVSVTHTFPARSAPALATANEYTSAPPTATGSGESVFATDKSAA